MNLNEKCNKLVENEVNNQMIEIDKEIQDKMRDVEYRVIRNITASFISSFIKKVYDTVANDRSAYKNVIAIATTIDNTEEDYALMIKYIILQPDFREKINTVFEELTGVDIFKILDDEHIIVDDNGDYTSIETTVNATVNNKNINAFDTMLSNLLYSDEGIYTPIVEKLCQEIRSNVDYMLTKFDFKKAIKIIKKSLLSNIFMLDTKFGISEGKYLFNICIETDIPKNTTDEYFEEAMFALVVTDIITTGDIGNLMESLNSTRDMTVVPIFIRGWDNSYGNKYILNLKVYITEEKFKEMKESVKSLNPFK